MVHYSIKPIENNLYWGTVFPDILIVYVSIVSDSQVHHSISENPSIMKRLNRPLEHSATSNISYICPSLAHCGKKFKTLVSFLEWIVEELSSCAEAC